VCGCVEPPFGERSTFAMYKSEINVSGRPRVFLFRGPRCRKTMLEWWDDCLRRADVGEDIHSIRVWGTVGHKTDIVLEWPPIERPAARSQQRSSTGRGLGR